MILFIRGLPGSGKTTISNLVAEKLHWEVISPDGYKKEFMKQNPDANFLKEVVPYSYKKTLEKLQDCITANIVIEEVFRNKDFVQQILSFCNQNKIKCQWFKIIRDKKLILEVNDERKRKVKNTPEVLDMMELQMNDIKIDGEIEIKNETTIEETVKKVLEFIQS